MRVGRAKSRRVVLLGPQRLLPTVQDVLPGLIGAGTPVAVVTAGWEEREGEIQELREKVDREVRNLELHRRGEDVFQRDAGLFAALQAAQDRLREIERFYRLRLRHLGAAWRTS
jgi:hypothetical protein